MVLIVLFKSKIKIIIIKLFVVLESIINKDHDKNEMQKHIVIMFVIIFIIL